MEATESKKQKGYSVTFSLDKLLTDKADIEAGIADVQAKGRSFERKLHLVACSCLHHVEATGDIGFINRLVLALPKSARRNALIEWSIAHGKLMWNEDGKKLVFSRTKTTDIEAAIEKPFWEFRPEPEYKPMNLIEEITKLIAKAEKRIAAAAEENKDLPDEIDMQLLSTLEGLVNYVKPVKDATGSVTVQ
jgi:hypothetical protein